MTKISLSSPALAVTNVTATTGVVLSARKVGSCGLLCLINSHLRRMCARRVYPPWGVSVCPRIHGIDMQRLRCWICWAQLRPMLLLFLSVLCLTSQFLARMDADVATARDPTLARAILASLKPTTIDHGPVMFLSAPPRVPTEARAKHLGSSMLADVQRAGVVHHVRPAFAIPIATRMATAATECMSGSPHTFMLTSSRCICDPGWSGVSCDTRKSICQSFTHVIAVCNAGCGSGVCASPGSCQSLCFAPPVY
jgi:hypothetical protein